MLLRAEPISLGGNALHRSGITTGTQRRLFNAGLTLIDGDGQRQGYLAETFPQLDTGSWQVFADGRMETTYHLKPGLTWHDDTPLSSADFVFAWQVYSTPSFGIGDSSPQSFMEEVIELDPRTLTIRWLRPFPEADLLEGFSKGTTDYRQFTPLPRHLLESAYLEQPQNFLSLPFWTVDYVGLGPYRIERWEPGAFLQAAAFANHALGKPRIERLKLAFNADANSVLATLLAGEAHMPADDSIRVQQGAVLKREWEARQLGTVQYVPSLWRSIHVQHRPEYANPAAILDARVRAALTHAIDKQAINEALFEGQAILGDIPVPPTDPLFARIAPTLVRYPFDLRRSEQLLAEAGYGRRSDGFVGSLAADGEARLNFELQVIASPQNEAERAIIADGWRRTGIEVEEAVITAAQIQDRQVFAVFRSLSTTSGAQGPNALSYFTTASISRPETRWIGQNRGGWSNLEFDRAFAAYQTTLHAAARVQHLVQATKLLTEQVGIIPLYFNPAAIAQPAAVRGIGVRAADAEMSWNVHLWEWS